jgi:hypothetical protein
LILLYTQTSGRNMTFVKNGGGSLSF